MKVRFENLCNSFVCLIKFIVYLPFFRLRSFCDAWLASICWDGIGCWCCRSLPFAVCLCLTWVIEWWCWHSLSNRCRGFASEADSAKSSWLLFAAVSVSWLVILSRIGSPFAFCSAWFEVAVVRFAWDTVVARTDSGASSSLDIEGDADR